MSERNHVLLIDDEEAIVNVVGDVLECFGFKVAVATSAHEGVRHACATLPDAIVCDVRMPEIGGEEVVHTLKSKPATAQIPIVLVSGYCEPGFAHMADAFLQKPFVVSELKALLQTLVKPARLKA